jgi:hypothetical protein
MDYAISRYRGRITFVATNVTLIPSYCRFEPCYAAYRNATRIAAEQPLMSAVHFAHWCEYVLDPDGCTLEHSEQLRPMFVRDLPFVFGLGLKSRPLSVPRDLPFYIVEQSVLRFFGFALPDGVYLYRPHDRQVLQFRGNFATETATKVKIAADN